MMSKPLPKFPHMPLHIKKGIIMELDFRTKRELRRVNKRTCEIVDDCPGHYRIIEISPIANKGLALCITDKDGVVVLKFTTHSHGGGFVESAIQTLFSILKHRQTQLKMFYFEKENWLTQNHTLLSLPTKRAFLEIFHREFSRLPHKLKSVLLELGCELTEDEILLFLPLFQPGTLKVLTLDIADGVTLNRVMEMDQWTQAVELTVRNAPDVSMFNFSHALLVETTKSVVTEQHLRDIIQNMLLPTESAKKFELIDVTYTLLDILNAVSAFELVTASNGLFVKMPESSGWLKIQKTETIITLIVVTEEYQEYWPVIRIEDDNQDDNALEARVEE